MPPDPGAAVDTWPPSAHGARVDGETLRIVVIALLQVFHRFALNSSLSWSEEAQIFGHIWIVFLGIPIAYRRGAHLYIETFCDKLPPRARRVFDAILHVARDDAVDEERRLTATAGRHRAALGRRRR